MEKREHKRKSENERSAAADANNNDIDVMGQEREQKGLFSFEENFN